MRKFLKNALLLVIGVAVGLAACLSVYYFSGDMLFERTIGTRQKTATAAANASNAELTDFAYKILKYIKAGDYDSLSKVVHPEFGVVFSPYATISLPSDKCFTATQVAAFAHDKNKYVWGKFDGSGKPIEMTTAEYFKRFVFDKDYMLASQIGVDTIIKTGNSLENITDAFPNVRFVDFHIPGSDKKSSGLDWSSLRLGFESWQGELKLTVVVHSEWTV